MTLIITAVSNDAVVQVSDRRLTFPDGRIYSERATKAICVECSDARVLLGYTGLARIGPTPTDHWIVDVLTEARAPSKTFLQVVRDLAGIATARFGGLRHFGNGRGLSVVLAGFDGAGPVIALISNQEDGAGQRLKVLSDRFKGQLWRPQPVRRLDIMVNGAESAVTPELRKTTIPRVRKYFFRRTPEERVRALVQLVRLAASEPTHGRFIGRDCMASIVTPDGQFRTTYHPVGRTVISYMPHYVSANFTIRDLWISSDFNQRPPWAL